MENLETTENVNHELESGSPSWFSRLGRVKSIFRYLGWISFALGLILIFTLAKLPTQQMGQILLHQINQQLQYAPGALEISAQDADLSLFPLPALQFKDLVLKSKDLTGGFLRVRWAELKLRPSLVDLMVGRWGGTLSLTINDEQDPALMGGAWFKSGKFSIDLRILKADLGNQGVGLLPILLHVNGKFPLQGSLQVKGDLSELSSINGLISLKLETLELPPQKIMAMDFPSLIIRGGEIRATIQDAKVKVDSFKLGQPSQSGTPPDDLRGMVGGEIGLGKTWDASKIDLKIQFEISDELSKAAWLLTSLLSPYKKEERSYRFGLSGPSYAPLMSPEGE